MYAIVRSGGRQHKVAVGDVLEIDRVDAAVGDSVALTPLMLVQVANGEKTVEEAESDLVSLCGVHPGLIGKHSSDDPDPVLREHVAWALAQSVKRLTGQDFGQQLVDQG